MTNAVPKEERDRVLMADAVIAELRQFERLRALDPPLTAAEIGHRMVWPEKEVKWLLKKLRDDRG